MAKKKPRKPRKVTLEQLPIELYKLLKFESLVQSGGEAKTLISEGHVLVNGEVETRKGKKIFAGDVVGLANQLIQIVQKETP